MSLVNIAAHFENRQLPDAVLAISKSGEERFTALYNRVSQEMQEDLSFLKRSALSSVLQLKQNTDPMYWTDLSINYLVMLQRKIEILERVATFRELIEPNKSLETILSFCKKEEQEGAIRSLLLSLPENQRAGFCKDLEMFLFCFETPREAMNIINSLQEYPANERAKLAQALLDIFGTKKKLLAILLNPLIPNIYMLLTNTEKLQEVRLQCQTFEEVQNMLTK